MYYNSAGYPDPTAGAVISKMMHEYKEQQKAIRRRQDEVKHRPKVYVVSKFAGEVKTNIRNARKYCRFVASKKKIPFASHLLYPQFINDADAKERELGLLFGMVWLALCDEVWCFGTEHSAGMQAELHEAKKLKKPIHYYSEEMEELK